MCRAVTCKVCGKTTWAGCGQHIDQVRATVPASQWCPGHDEGADAAKGAASVGAGRASSGSGESFFARLFGR